MNEPIGDELLEVTLTCWQGLQQPLWGIAAAAIVSVVYMVIVVPYRQRKAARSGDKS